MTAPYSNNLNDYTLNELSETLRLEFLEEIIGDSEEIDPNFDNDKFLNRIATSIKLNGVEMTAFAYDMSLAVINGIASELDIES